VCKESSLLSDLIEKNTWSGMGDFFREQCMALQIECEDLAARGVVSGGGAVKKAKAGAALSAAGAGSAGGVGVGVAGGRRTAGKGETTEMLFWDCFLRILVSLAFSLGPRRAHQGCRTHVEAFSFNNSL
jgi:hypothetical protein